MTSGFKAMIRDKCPHVVDLALKWCTEFGRLVNQQIEDPAKRFPFKCKTRWIERVYQENVEIFNTNKNNPRKDEKLAQLHMALGIHDGKQNFNFADSINLENINKLIDPMELKFWIWVNNWVIWFQKRYAYIKNAYDISGGKDDNWKQIVKSDAFYLEGYLDDFVNYLEETFKS